MQTPKESINFMLMDKYKFIEKIGRGTHGTVYLLENIKKNKEPVVCKSILNKHKKQAKNEVKILSLLNHSRIVTFYESMQFKESTFIILEYANHGTLDTVIKYFTKSKRRSTNFFIWSVLSQISDALEYLHHKGIMHRDIKPGNILVNQVTHSGLLEFKLCDFSLSICCSEIESSIIGTPFYMAPEITKQKKYDGRVDVWGLGVSLYELCTLKKPFKGETRQELYDEICNKEIKKNFVVEDEELEEMILRCLKKEGRPTSKEIKENQKIKLYLAEVEIKMKDEIIKKLEEKLKILEDEDQGKTEQGKTEGKQDKVKTEGKQDKVKQDKVKSSPGMAVNRDKMDRSRVDWPPTPG